MYNSDETLDPIIMEALKRLVLRDLEASPISVSPKKQSDYLKIGDLLSGTIQGYEDYTEIFSFSFIQTRAPVFTPTGQNQTTGSLHISTMQCILYNGGYIPACENCLYNNLKIDTGSYIHIIDADTPNIIMRQRNFTNITIRGIYTYMNYVVIELQFTATDSTHTIFGHDNVQQGTTTSGYDLLTSTSYNEAGSEE